jgi:hypothetical protein
MAGNRTHIPHHPGLWDENLWFQWIRANNQSQGIHINILSGKAPSGGILELSAVDVCRCRGFLSGARSVKVGTKFISKPTVIGLMMNLLSPNLRKLPAKLNRGFLPFRFCSLWLVSGVEPLTRPNRIWCLRSEVSVERSTAPAAS